MPLDGVERRGLTVACVSSQTKRTKTDRALWPVSCSATGCWVTRFRLGATISVDSGDEVEWPREMLYVLSVVVDVVAFIGELLWLETAVNWLRRQLHPEWPLYGRRDDSE